MKYYGQSLLRVLSTFLLLLSFVSGHSDPLDIWHWRNPTPTGNHLNAVAFGEGMFVAVDGTGLILTSSDGVSWTSHGIRAGINANHLAYGNGKFVLVGAGGLVMSSDDGIVWTEHASATTRNLASVIYGQGLYVAVGDAGTILSSTDAITWSPRTANLETNPNLLSVTYGNGLFVAGGDGNKVVTSPDGVVWTPYALDNQNDWSIHLAYGDGVFVATGLSSVHIFTNPYTWTSTNGMNWVRLSSQNGTGRLIFGAGTFVSLNVYPNGVATSVLPLSWTSHPFLEGETPRAIAYGNGAFVIVGADGLIAHSTNAVDWTMINSGDQTFQVDDAVYAQGVYVLVGSTILSSADGRTFTRHDEAGTTFNAVAHGSGRFVAIGNERLVAHSVDGATWQQARSSTLRTLRDLAYGGGVFVAVGDTGAIQTSDDGIVWTGRWAGTDYHLYGVTYHQDMFVAVGYLGIVITSPDGITWTVQHTDDLNTLHSVASGQGQLVAVGESGAVITSRDGTTWSRQDSGQVNLLSRVAFGGGQFLASASGGVFSPIGGGLLSSADGTNWVRRNSGTAFSVVPSFVNNTFMLLGANGRILQSEPVGAISLRVVKNAETGLLEVKVNGGQIGTTYRLQKCRNLAAGSWSDITTFTASAAPATVVVPEDGVIAQNFFRVVTP